MGYQQALEATGVVVKEYKEFGSYQGTWIAILKDGRFIEGSYGSCSECDAFEAEFSYAYENTPDFQERLRLFGESYLASSETKDEIIQRYTRKCEDGKYVWDDDKEILEWLKTF